MRAALEALCQLVVRIFFRRIEVVGLERLPDGGILLTPNHQNALLDPLFIATQCPRPVSFLAKASLFDTFLIKHFIRAYDCLPIYRQQDGYDTSKNRETLEKAREVLGRGAAIAIFPEGKSHHAPQLARLKTGAARIALGAASEGADVYVVPCGIVWFDKQIFRSDAALVFGEPVRVPQVALDEAGEPPRPDATALTEMIKERLETLLVSAQSHDLLRLAGTATRLVRGAQRERGEDDEDSSDGELERERQLRKRLIAGYEQLGHEEEVRALVGRMTRLESLYAHAGVDPASGGAFPAGRALLWLLGWTVMFPYAIAGMIANWPVYRFVGWIAHRAAKGNEDAVATMKMLGGLLFFPISWLIGAGVALGVAGPIAGLVALLVQPSAAYLALLLSEAVPRVGGWLAAIRLRLSGGDLYRSMREERASIYDALVGLSKGLSEDPPAP